MVGHSPPRCLSIRLCPCRSSTATVEGVSVLFEEFLPKCQLGIPSLALSRVPVVARESCRVFLFSIEKSVESKAMELLEVVFLQSCISFLFMSRRLSPSALVAIVHSSRDPSFTINYFFRAFRAPWAFPIQNRDRPVRNVRRPPFCASWDGASSSRE